MNNRSLELRQKLVALHQNGKHFDCGSLIYTFPGARKAQDKLVGLLSSKYGPSLSIHNFAWEMGYVSFADCIIRTKQKIEPNQETKCLYILLCNYLNICVLGEHKYYGGSIDFLPEFESIDQFTNKNVCLASEEVTDILLQTDYERVFAYELDDTLPESIETKSNLVGEYPRVFDGYFNWTD